LLEKETNKVYLPENKNYILLVVPQKAESQMAERTSRKIVFLASGRICKSSNLNWPDPEQVVLCSRVLVSIHLLWIRPTSPCNRLAKKGQYDRSENFHFFREKSRFFMN
jgi:hypothetical protein